MAGVVVAAVAEAADEARAAIMADAAPMGGADKAEADASEI